MEKSNCLKILARWTSYEYINLSFLAVMVHGWLFRVETGFIEELEIEESIPNNLSKVFKLNFKPTQQPPKFK